MVAGLVEERPPPSGDRVNARRVMIREFLEPMADDATTLLRRNVIGKDDSASSSLWCSA